MATSTDAVSFGASFNKDLKSATDLGTKLEAADSAYQKALASGEEKNIGPAKLKYDKAQEQFMAFVGAKNKEHDMIMQLIAMISR